MKPKMVLSTSINHLLFFATMFMLYTTCLRAQNTNKMKKKILFVVTSHDQKGNTGEKTGFYLSEVAHPWDVLVNAEYEIDFVSPRGGKAPVTGFTLEDSINKKFWENRSYRYKIENTLMPSEVKINDYVAIHYAGGLGAMWDFTDNKALASIATKIYENGGVISAVCHGPAGLVNIKLSNGKYLVDGKKINAFTNEEEEAIKMEKVVPFLLEPALIERGAIFEKSGVAQVHVVTDQRVVTGQNPESAKAVGEAVLELLINKDVVAKLTRYEVSQFYQEQLRKAINNYIMQSLVAESNIMSEAYYEKENPNVFWLIERWKNRAALDKSNTDIPFRVIEALVKEAVTQPPKSFYVKDLEPLSKQQWRKTAKKEDNPITVMLFVDAKPGTQDTFKDVYHIAMPQFRSEPGVVTYQISQLEEDVTKFVTYEKFRNDEAFQYHLKFPPIQPVIDYLQTSIKKQPFQTGLRNLIEFAPLTRE